MQLIHTQVSQLTEAHIDNCFRLQFVKLKSLLQITLSISRCLARTDNTNNLIYVIASDDKAFQNVRTLLSFLQFEVCATDCNLLTMLNKVIDTLL